MKQLSALWAAIVILAGFCGWQVIEIRNLRGHLEAAEEHIDTERDERTASYVQHGEKLLYLIKRNGESESQIAEMDTDIKKLSGTLNFLNSERDDDSALAVKTERELELLATKNDSQFKRIQKELDFLASEIDRMRKR